MVTQHGEGLLKIILTIVPSVVKDIFIKIKSPQDFCIT